MQRVFITGGTGFIGRYVVQALLTSGCSVRVLCRDSDRAEGLPAQIERYFGDVSTGHGIASAVQDVDTVVHLAASGFGPTSSIDTPLETAMVNLVGTLNLLEQARLAGVQKFVFASTVQVYGDAPPPHTPSSAVHPLTPYGLQKYQAELAVRQYAELYGMQTVSLRLFNVYGAGMGEVDGWKSVVQLFLERAQQGLPIILGKDGLKRRDFVHVIDVADAFVRACSPSRAVHGEVFNIASGKTYSLLELAQCFGVPIESEPLVPDEAGWVPAASLTETYDCLGWRPTIALLDGIRLLLDKRCLLPLTRPLGTLFLYAPSSHYPKRWFHGRQALIWHVQCFDHQA